jgi:hypothetical protein
MKVILHWTNKYIYFLVAFCSKVYLLLFNNYLHFQISLYFTFRILVPSVLASWPVFSSKRHISPLRLQWCRRTPAPSPIPQLLWNITNIPPPDVGEESRERPLSAVTARPVRLPPPFVMAANQTNGTTRPAWDALKRIRVLAGPWTHHMYNVIYIQNGQGLHQLKHYYESESRSSHSSGG